MASTSFRKQPIVSAATKDAEPSGKGRKGQIRGKGKQAAKRGKTSKLGVGHIEADKQPSTNQKEIDEDSSASGSSSTIHSLPASAAAAMEDQGALMGKKAMAPPLGMPPGMPGMEDMMKMMGDMPDDLKKIMATMDMKNFSFTGFVEHVCMAAWQSKDDGTGGPLQHIPEGSDSRRLLMALARGDSEGEAAAESLTLIEDAAFKKPFELATRVLRGKKLMELEKPGVEPLRTTRSQRSALETEKPQAGEDPESPAIEGRQRSRGSKRASDDDDDKGAAAPAAAESPEKSVAVSKKRRILVSLIKGESHDGQETSYQGVTGPKTASGSKGQEAEEPSPPAEPSSRLKKNAKNFIGKKIVFVMSQDEGMQWGQEKEKGCNPALPSWASVLPTGRVVRENECAVCGDLFDTKYSIKSHMQIHSGVRPFACEKCGKTFTHKASLKAHLNVHAREVQNFYCKLCDRNFAYAHQLERHNKSHKRHQCKICGKFLRRAEELNKHMRNEHHTKFSYGCDVCSKSYARFSAFLAHQLTHTDNPSVMENVEFDDGLERDNEEVQVSQEGMGGAGASVPDKEMEGAREEEDCVEAPRVVTVATV